MQKGTGTATRTSPLAIQVRSIERYSDVNRQ